MNSPARKLHQTSYAQMRDLSHQLVSIEAELHRLGLHITARATNRAVKAIGWEFSGNLTEASKASKVSK